MRLIDADALIEQLKSSSAYNDYEWAMYADGFIEDIENAPTIEPKRGKWIQSHSFGYANCSVCGVFWDWGHIKNCNMDFCPNCGADMREREGE